MQNDSRGILNHRIFAERQRRRMASNPELSAWLETVDRLQRTPTRTDTERTAKFEALRLMELSRPGAAEQRGTAEHG